MSQARHVWTDADNSAIARGLKADTSYLDIADSLGRSRQAVKAQARKLRINKAKPVGAPGSWHDDRVDLLKLLWAEGLSASQIAGRLGHVTRNAVIGKVHRLGLQSRVTKARKKNAPRRATPRDSKTYDNNGLSRKRKTLTASNRYTIGVGNPRLVAEPMPMPTPTEMDIPRIKFADVTDALCKWIVTTSGPAMCCGDTSVPNKPYCLGHLERASPAYLQPPRRTSSGKVLANAV